MTAIYLANFEPLDDPFVDRRPDARASYSRGANFPISGREFPAGSPRSAYYYAYVPDYVSTPTIDLLWATPGGGSNNVTWLSALAAITPGDTGRLVDKVFASTNTVTTAASGDWRLTKSTITVTNTDSLAAGDLLIVRIQRDASDVSNSAKAILIAASFNYTGS